MLPLLLIPAGLAASRYLLNKNIEKKTWRAIEEARIKAVEEATLSGVSLIKKKTYEWITQKIAEGLIVFIPIFLMKMGLFGHSFAGILATIIFLLIMLSKINLYIDHIKMIRGVVRERGFSIREIAASIIYEKVYSEVARKFEEKTNGLVTRAAIFFSKHCRHQLKDYVASSVAEVAANLTPKRIFLGSVTSIIGGIFGLITYSIFFNSMISPYIF